ncbi:MAG TPA: helicase-related protein, partial [Candidatus Brocadiales bacterium]|nr:helicase-related protein [Candidatus Brocadiales bacterium]
MTSLIGAHHSSLSKEHRFAIETALREGRLRAVVCSTSLELGIDIGYIDLVILLGSPKSVARALQRVGRSGHQLHATTKGRIIVLDRDDLIECSVLLKHAVEKKIDKIHIPSNCLDVLAQQLVGIALEQMWDIEELYRMLRQSYCYRALEWKDYDELLAYLAGEYISLEDRHIYARIWYDREQKKIGKKGKMSRVIYMTNIGTIPDQTGVTVKIGTHKIGSIDEIFMERLNVGDRFVLGGEVYEFKHARGMVAQVTAATGKKPTVPSWFSENLPLSFDLAIGIQKFRLIIKEKFDAKEKKAQVISFIHDYLYIDDNAAHAIYNYLREQYLYIGMPNEKELYVEYYKEGGKWYVIFHSLYGRRVNDAFARSVAYAVSRVLHEDVSITISDNGFMLVLNKHVAIMPVLSLIKVKDFQGILRNAIDKTEVLKRRFRHCAGRALMILRNYKGRIK